jgi:hypothetical protein
LLEELAGDELTGDGREPIDPRRREEGRPAVGRRARGVRVGVSDDATELPDVRAATSST